MKSWRITTEPVILEGNDEFEVISSWFQMIQFTGFFIQEYKGAEPIGEKGNRRLVIAENKTGGQLIISVKEESKADMIRANQELRKKVQCLADNNYLTDLGQQLKQVLDSTREERSV